MEVEITEAPDLSEEQLVGLEYHSILNIVNVLISDIFSIEDCIGKRATLAEALEATYQISDALKNREETTRLLSNLDAYREKIFRQVSGLGREISDQVDRKALEEAIDRIHTVLDIFQVRARELIKRLKNPLKWETFDIQDLKHNFVNVLTAIEQNSRGRYHIVYNIALKEEGDYLVDFSVSSVDGKIIRIPAVFQDVMRDLIANARKYTDPGGSIHAGLSANTEKIRFVVEDSGRGIPFDQIKKVVRFGERGRNVKPGETKGGGFGLTKAWYVTHLFGGKMWIKSRLFMGTRVTIEIPCA